MNWQEMQGKWKEYSGKARERWGRLSDDDLEKIAGQRDQLVGKIQQSYGIAKEEAEKQVAEFERASERMGKAAGKPH